MKIRQYNKETDYEYIKRIWKEIGWYSCTDEKEGFNNYLEAKDVLVAEINDEVEAMVATGPGEIRYQDQDLELNVIRGVTISRVARKQGLAKKMTAKAIADSALKGAKISALDMFEQGFYNKLGYGNGSYENIFGFNPAHLKVKTHHRPPKRISKEDWEQIYNARMKMMRKHGGCIMTHPLETKSPVFWADKYFTLGYHNDQGELTHFMRCRVDNASHGPYAVDWLVYQNKEQFLELLSLLKSLGDQVNLIYMREPSWIQLQDLLDKPFVNRRVTKDSNYEWVQNMSNYWQMRILNLEGCLAKTHLLEEVKFNLTLADPIEDILPEDAEWKGIGGQYIVTLGPTSKAEPGQGDNLPILKATIGAFTRMWLGVRPATGISVTDQLDGPDSLLEDLDRVFRILPQPKNDWIF